MQESFSEAPSGALFVQVQEWRQSHCDGKVEGGQCLSVHLPLTFLYELAGAASAILGSGFLSFARLAGVVQPESAKDFMFHGANKSLGIFLSLSHPCGL